MSSSGSRDVVGCGVGSIVWVRRRNGSWWPGTILGPDDISTTHLTSPRAGTPVRLLGREDASIDWYNLEKSKRVKAFRCGEFDDDIERAEAALELPPKKREKYARREDAILHALQLDRRLKNQVSNDPSGTVKEESSPLSENLRNDDAEFVISEPARKPNSEDDLETVPQTKGLQDFGHGSAPSKRKFSSIASNDTCEVDSKSQAPPDDVCHLNARETNGIMGDVIRPGNSKCASLPTDLTNSVEDSKEIPLSLIKMAPRQIREENHPHSGSAVEINPVRVLSDSSDNESDASKTEEEMDDRISAHPGSETVLKWEQKGKRTIRNPTRRPAVATRGRGSLNTFTGFSQRIPGQSSDHYREDFYIDVDDDDDDDGTDFYPEDTNAEMVGADGREYMFMPRSMSNYRYRPSRGLLDWESVWDDDNALKGHREDRSEQVNPMYVSHSYRMSPILINVDLKVQGAGYQTGSVPMKSLISKISGQPVVGYPIKIDVLEDGSTEDMISNNVGSDYEMTDCDGIATLPLSWKTGRRTANSRVPRTHMSSNLGNEHAEGLSPSDQEREEPVKRFSLKRKGQTIISFPVNSRRYSGNAPKKVSLLPGERTRTLSSVASDQMDGPNYTVSPGLRSVSSIPCNLVFSRLLDKINRH